MGFLLLLMKRQIYQALDNSIGARFVEDIEGKAQIREEFLGFIPLEDMDAATIADSIIDQAKKCTVKATMDVVRWLEMTMLFRLESEKKYPKATFAHCASHRLRQ